jgi:hypothetical protein
VYEKDRRGIQRHIFSDFWEAYEKVFPKETHRSGNRESGGTKHAGLLLNTNG